MTISAPKAPASMILRKAMKAALLKWNPLSSATASLKATILAERYGFSTVVTVICGFSSPNLFSKIWASCLIIEPLLPIIIAGLSA